MKFTPLLSGTLLAVLALTGCKTTGDKERDNVAAPTGTLTDQSDDVTFRAFLSRLRKAVAKRDVEMLVQMMSADFGYSWGPGGEGVGVFAYWDRHNLWPEVSAVLSQSFVLSGDYMVAPPDVVSSPGYPGYRAGLRLVNGSWRFAYFVPAPEQ